MNLLELNDLSSRAIENAKELGEDPRDILVSIQIDDEENDSLWSDDIKLIYDGNACASGCVLYGWRYRAKDMRHCTFDGQCSGVNVGCLNCDYFRTA